jgi:hypothetical protein
VASLPGSFYASAAGGFLQEWFGKIVCNVSQCRLEKVVLHVNRGKIHSIPSIWFAVFLQSGSHFLYRPLRARHLFRGVNTDAEFAMIEAARVEKQSAGVRKPSARKNKRMIAS